MHTLALNWGWFLLSAFVFLILAGTFQFLKMRSFAKHWDDRDFEVSAIFHSMLPLIFCGIASQVSGLLFVMGFVANLLGK